MGRPVFGLLLLLVVFSSGCRGAGQAAPPPAPSRTAVGPRIGVVDVDAVARVHFRWPELDALNKRLAEVEAELAAPPQVPPVVQARLDAQLRAQARRLQTEFRAEVAALRARQEATLARYAERMKAEQGAKLGRLQAQIDADLTQAMEARTRALRTELHQYEVAVMDEYRFPIANLRLKADVVGVATEEELRRITGELDRLQNERDEKVRARAEVMGVTLDDFRKARVAEATARLGRTRREAEAELGRLVAERKKELETQTARVGRTKQRAFEARLRTFRQRLLGIGQGQLASAQGRYLEGLRAREQQLLAEQQALQEQRARLQDSILADVKIEVAAIAAARGFDVVLTRYLSNVTGEDFTADVLARMKR